MDVATGTHGICLLDTDAERIDSPLGCQKQAWEQKTPSEPIQVLVMASTHAHEAWYPVDSGFVKEYMRLGGKSSIRVREEMERRSGWESIQSKHIIFMYKTSNNRRMSELEMGLVQSRRGNLGFWWFEIVLQNLFSPQAWTRDSN